MEEHLEKIVAVAQRAGEIILEYYQLLPSDLEVQKKADNSPLTKADLEANHYIVEQLHKLDPSIPIISEESRIPPFPERKNWTKFWLVDPLDGTKEFLRKRDHFTVNIALVENQIPILGVIYGPAVEMLYFASQQSGSWKMLHNQAKRIFSKPPTKNQPIVILTSKSHSTAQEEQIFRQLPTATRLSLGSSLKFCLLADGQGHIYPRYGPTMEWDVAAGDCIFRYCAENGEHASPFSYNKSDLRNDSFVLDPFHLLKTKP